MIIKAPITTATARCVRVCKRSISGSKGYPDYLHSMVRVMEGGEEVKFLSAGSHVTLGELIEWVGRAHSLLPLRANR